MASGCRSAALDAEGTPYRRAPRPSPRPYTVSVANSFVGNFVWVYGWFGMEPEDERKAYDLFIIRADGKAELFQHYPQAGIPV
ncbi:MAG: hypothetical protein P8M25_08700 [Paracoccaceae bacterium]|nr:hypothetical protein [Paracoccaceae bacterium]